MRKGLALLLAVAATTGRVEAGVFTDDLSRCLVEAAKPEDRALLMRWMFAAYAASDAAKGIANLTPAQHTAFNKEGAALFRRLLFQDCRKQAVAALKNEGAISIQQSFETLGQIAGRGIIADPKVAVQMDEFGTMIDPADIAALGKDAGIQLAPPK